MKRISSFLLLLLFLFNVAGYYGVFILQKQQIRKEVKRIIKNSVPEQELLVLSFHPSSKEYAELQWIEGHEFRYNGRMFDIIRQSTDADGTVHYHCINDKQEESLFAHLDEYVAKNSDTRSSAAKNAVSSFSLFPPSPVFMHFYSATTETSYPKYSADAYCSPALAIVSPPPRIS